MRIITLEIIAIVCLTALEIVALKSGIDGKIFVIVIASISGIAGYNISNIFNKRR
jgi:hypothetical protein